MLIDQKTKQTLELIDDFRQERCKVSETLKANRDALMKAGRVDEAEVCRNRLVELSKHNIHLINLARKVRSKIPQRALINDLAALTEEARNSTRQLRSLPDAMNSATALERLLLQVSELRV